MVGSFIISQSLSDTHTSTAIARARLNLNSYSKVYGQSGNHKIKKTEHSNEDISIAKVFVIPSLA